MAKMTLGEKTYDTDSMSEVALAQLKSLQFADKELQAVNSRIALAETARKAYANALVEALPASEAIDQGSNNIQIDGISYEVDTLSTEAKDGIGSVRSIDQTLQRLHAEVAMLKTARSAYFSALQKAVESA